MTPTSPRPSSPSTAENDHAAGHPFSPTTEAPTATASLAEQLRDDLRTRIVETRLHPGGLVLEKSIAAEFGVSKTPVREALQLLAAEGWVTVLPRRGYTVSTVGFNDIREVMELRRAVEPEIAAAAAACRTPELVADLEDLLRQHVEASSAPEAVSAAHEFHHRLAASARNRRGRRLLETLWLETERAHRLLPPLAEYINDETEHLAHRGLLAAVDSGDPDRARETMRTHLDEAQEAMVNAFLSRHTP